ncbi:FadR family transcriptional regulator [Arthrobacter sp. PO-11]|uniref:FadR family transcriptional regulator n=1 Tax=Arthrobacter cavernae TaxID=2817681 RepID=A0A939KMI1_9MICC|nr:FadR family transcriptional regulator [Arthrobacter cavernae]
MSDSRTAGQADTGQPASSQKAAAGQRPATSGAVPRPAQGAVSRPATSRPAPRPLTEPRPLTRVSAAEAVFSAIRHDIESGAFGIGAKLSSEATLATQYGVSRSVIREALRSCNTLGLTVTKTGKGTFVVSNHVANDLTLGQYSARDLNEARPHIEVPAAGLAAQRRTEEDLEHLKDLVQAMLTETDPEAWVSLDANFHSAVARASGNRVFASVVSEIREALAHQSETLNMVADRQHLSDEEHLAVLDAIEAGDADAASHAMAEHLNAVAAALDSILSK